MPSARVWMWRRTLISNNREGDFRNEAATEALGVKTIYQPSDLLQSMIMGQRMARPFNQLQESFLRHWSDSTAIKLTSRVARTSYGQAESMALNCSSPSRNYDDLMHDVLFLGYDQKFKITFLIEGGALLKLNANTKADDMRFLEMFDTNRNRIYLVAAKIYSHHRKGFFIVSFTMSV